MQPHPLLLLLFFASACSLPDSHHRPGTPARVLVVVEVAPAAGSTAKEALDTMYPILLKRLINAGITYQKIEVDEAERTISFYLIDGPANEGKPTTYPVAYFKEALTTKAKLEFWDTYRISDAELFNAFVQLGATHELFRHLRINQNYELGSAAVLGIAKEEMIRVVDSLLALPEVKGVFPQDISFKWSRAVGYIQELYGIKTPDTGPVLTEKHLKYAHGALDEISDSPQISLGFNEKGAIIWAQMTTRATQNGNREIAIVLNDEVLSAPRVMSPIMGGQSMMSGNFTLGEVDDMALRLQIASLPHSLKIVQARAL
ncbi:MAG: hypothetical protein KF852_08585 [Saprospiraceae bacterium]|nr:hypothetical protein [Saprospiraceae bacterium]